MGAGASAGVSAAVNAATPRGLQAALAELSAEQKQKLRSVLEAAGSPWVEEFVICGQLACKDIPTASAGALKDASIQVRLEPRAPRMTIFGVATGEQPSEAKDKVFWLAEFECMEAWAGPEHKERENNKQFTTEFMSIGMTGNPLEDMVGSYTGLAWHVEKPGNNSQQGVDVFAVQTRAKAKDVDSAEKIVELIKTTALAHLQAQEDLLRCTVMRTANMVGPLAKDDVTVQWILVWKTAADYARHKEGNCFEEMEAKLTDLISATPVVFEFGQTKHFAK